MLITSDLHFTDRERDQYRWDLFPWLKKQLKKTHSRELLILGDLTDSKDGHSAALVNRIIENLLALPAKVYVLKGNHDYVDDCEPFFGFMNFDNLHFIKEPTPIDTSVGHVLLLPHTRTPVEDWKNTKWDSVDMWRYDYDLICCHQTFDGADAGGGFRLQGGIGANFFTHTLNVQIPVIAGDIHVPQHIGDIEYVGTPYPVTFGDGHEPRILEVFTGAQGVTFAPIPVPTIKKANLTVGDVGCLKPAGLRKGDQVKVTVELPREEFAGWAEYRQGIMDEAEALGVRVHSIQLTERANKAPARPATATERKKAGRDPLELLTDFCEQRQLGEGITDTGQEFLEQVT